MSEVRRTAPEAAAPDNVIAFQGALGAYSAMACREARPQIATLPCASFEDTFAGVRAGRARYAMIHIEHSSAGRVAGIPHLLPGPGRPIMRGAVPKETHQQMAPTGRATDRN